MMKEGKGGGCACGSSLTWYLWIGLSASAAQFRYILLKHRGWQPDPLADSVGKGSGFPLPCIMRMQDREWERRLGTDGGGLGLGLGLRHWFLLFTILFFPSCFNEDNDR